MTTENFESIYERLVKLKDDPVEFDKAKNEVFENFIQCYPEPRRERLRSMQWRIEQELKRYKDPVARFNHMVAMFFEGVQKFHLTLAGVAKGEATSQPTDSNKVIAFKRPNG